MFLREENQDPEIYINTWYFFFFLIKCHYFPSFYKSLSNIDTFSIIFVRKLVKGEKKIPIFATTFHLYSAQLVPRANEWNIESHISRENGNRFTNKPGRLMKYSILGKWKPMRIEWRRDGINKERTWTKVEPEVDRYVRRRMARNLSRG